MKAVAPRHMVVGDREYEFPYSKGLMASAIMATGLAPGRAFHVAEVIEERLDEQAVVSISRIDLNELAKDVLRSEVGDRYAESFFKWQMVQRLDLPLVILLGGATGVGKSTIATMLASRLGITRVIPTDAIREVMRSMFTEDLFPSLHTSSFDAARLVPCLTFRHPGDGRMTMTAERKSALMKDYGTKPGDTGSPEVQVALLTERINGLTDHFKTHKKDNHSRRGLLKMVSLRRGLLDFLKSKDEGRYQALIKRLEIRR